MEENFEKRRFKMLDLFHKDAKTEIQHSLANIKCEPTWVVNGKQYMLFETEPERVLVIEKSIEDFEQLKKDLVRYWELKQDRETYENEETYRELSLLSIKLFHKEE